MAQTTLVQRDYYDVDEVTELIGMSKSFCYKLVQNLNKELKEKGCIVFPGKVPKKYLQSTTSSRPFTARVYLCSPYFSFTLYHKSLVEFVIAFNPFFILTTP